MRFTALIFIFAALFACARVDSRPYNMKTSLASSFHDFKVKSIEGKEINFAELKGKKVLIVNTASECGYTPQYADLQMLQEKYAEKLVVIGFPSNDFGGQEPGSNEDIKGFCTKNFGVSFPMMEKVTVKGTEMHPLFKWLSVKELNGWNNKAPDWNFCKYLVDEEGKLLKFYSSGVNPMSDEITSVL